MKEFHFLVLKLVFLWVLFLTPGMIIAAEITVNSGGDTGSAPEVCELRSAIMAANDDRPVDACVGGSGADTIVFSNQGTIELSSDLPDIVESLVIQGLGFARLRIDGAGRFRQFTFVSGSGDHEIRDLGLTGGLTTGPGGCVRSEAANLTIEKVVMSKCQATGVGGALWALGNTTVLASYFTDNSTPANGGAIFFGTGTYEITDTTFQSNAASGDISDGGAIALTGGTATLLRNTFFDNQAGRQGGAINGLGAMTITSSTIVGNRSDANDDDNGSGGGIFFFNGDLTLENTIVAGNIDTSLSSRPDISPGLNLNIVTNGSNLVGITTGVLVGFPLGSPNVSGDFVGWVEAPLDPGLEAIGSFGGPFPTMPPMRSGFVVDKGNCPGELTDQRGFFNVDSDLRIINNPPPNVSDGCDIGSVELSLYLDGVFGDGFEQPETADQ